MAVTITVENIQKANALFWEQMLAMELDICSEAWDRRDEERCIGAEHVVAHCDLSGVWAGRIEVRLSQGLALQATSAMLMQPIETVIPADILDATKEIANMIAGTLKSALPRPCTMTVPSAQLEADDFCILPLTHNSVTVFFRHRSGDLMVRVRDQTIDESCLNDAVVQACA